ncbi:PP2C family protein-serine/threonine phosphatase [Streptomyces sp. NPDC059176]|uniref:PP2C family protein-serine/threonine phosphatase n=1 Tax=unclassified Streptomyces TaxID=2593676 RepID=UPI003677E547
MYTSDARGQQGTEARRGLVASLFSVPALLVYMVVFTAVLVLTAHLSPREAKVVPLLIVFPALVAGRGTVRQTEIAACWVTAVVAASEFLNPLPTAANSVTLVAFTIVLNGASVAMARQRTRNEAEITRLRSAAAALQRQILRPLPLHTEELVVSGLYEPVEEDSRVGGDIYEVVASGFGSRVLIADVQGKGLPAIGTAFAVLGAFREAANREPALTAVVDALENAVVRHNAFALQSGESERFVTALVISVTGEPEAEAVNCGHIAPYRLDGRSGNPDGGGASSRVLRREPGVPLGLGALSPSPRTAERFPFPASTSLLLCTDGVTEARDASGAFYPLEDRLSEWGDITPGQVVDTLRDELRRYTGGRPRDDTAVLVLSRAQAAALRPGTVGRP